MHSPSALLAPGPQVDALRQIVAELMDLPQENRYFGTHLPGRVLLVRSYCNRARHRYAHRRAVLTEALRERGVSVQARDGLTL